MAAHRPRRWLAAGAVVIAIGATTVVTALAGADGQQPPPGAPATVGEDVPGAAQPPAGAPATQGAAAELGTQPANPSPELSPGPSAQPGPQPEVEGAGRPSEAGEVDISVSGRPD